jgi:hypothetical protein
MAVIEVDKKEDILGLALICDGDEQAGGNEMIVDNSDNPLRFPAPPRDGE